MLTKHRNWNHRDRDREPYHRDREPYHRDREPYHRDTKQDKPYSLNHSISSKIAL
jgi:hypothetical protein